MFPYFYHDASHDAPRPCQIAAQLPTLQAREDGPDPSGVWCGESARERNVRGGSAGLP